MTHEIINSLRQIGLTQSEANVYIAVLKLGRTTISSIARETTLNRRNIYDVTSTLIEKGLIFTIIGEKERLYAAIEPDKLLEMVESKEKSLERIMPELHNLFNKEFVNDRAMMYQGVEGFKQYLQNVLNVGEDVRCVGAKGGWGFEKLGDFIEWFESERIKKKTQRVTTI